MVKGTKQPKAGKGTGNGGDGPADPGRRRALIGMAATTGAAATAGPAALAAAVQAGGVDFVAELAKTGVNFPELLAIINDGSDANELHAILGGINKELQKAKSPLKMVENLRSLLKSDFSDYSEVTPQDIFDPTQTFARALLGGDFDDTDPAALLRWQEDKSHFGSGGALRQKQRSSIRTLLENAGIHEGEDYTTPFSELGDRISQHVLRDFAPQLRQAYATDPEGLAKIIGHEFRNWKSEKYMPQLRKMLGVDVEGVDGVSTDEFEKWMKLVEENVKSPKKKKLFEVFALEFALGDSHRSFLIDYDRDTPKTLRDLSAEKLGIPENELEWQDNILTVPTHSTAAEILSHISGSEKRRVQVIPKAHVDAETAALEAGKVAEMPEAGRNNS